MEEYRTYAHTPPHLYRAGSKYFITASTFENRRLFDDAVKEKLYSSLLKSCVNHGWSLEDWVILDNHYHIMVNAPEVSANPAKLVSEYHRFTALFIRINNPEYGTLSNFFNNYWDTCVTFEKSYYARLNYIYNNPVKHGYVNHAQDCQWGSFRIRYANDRSYIDKMFENYPYDSVNVIDDF